jgi:hypothetical protein
MAFGAQFGNNSQGGIESAGIVLLLSPNPNPPGPLN